LIHGHQLARYSRATAIRCNRNTDLNDDGQRFIQVCEEVFSGVLFSGLNPRISNLRQVSHKSSKSLARLKRLIEPAAWILALVAIWFWIPHDGGGVTLCLFHHAGLTWCPGCGIGTSMALLMHGDVAASLKAHWFGIPALLVISLRAVHTSVSAIRADEAYPSTRNPTRKTLTQRAN
jgi:hypothetical protein